MNNFLDSLNSFPVLLDGAMGTQLFNAGLTPGNPPELWNIEKPDVVSSIHKKYISAGSNIIETNTFGANNYRLALTCHQELVYQLNKAGAELAVNTVAETNTLVAGSIGPLGEMLEPFGSISEQDASDAFLQQMKGLFDGGVNFFLIETMIALDEALIALKTAKNNFNIPVAVTLTFELNGSDINTPFGNSIEEAVSKLSENGVDIIGSNCGNGFKEMAIIGKRLKELTPLPILLQPNAGIPIIDNGSLIYRESPDEYAAFCLDMKNIGISFLGGCCGTDYNHISVANVVIKK